jgi:hypothetical protein
MSLFSTALGLLFALLFSAANASALELDWHGEFRAETNYLFGYSNSSYGAPTYTSPNTFANDTGYTVPNNGSNPAEFQNLFLELTPRAIVNDNVSIHSNIWVGSPDKGVFGGGSPVGTSSANPLNPNGKSYYYNTQTGNSALSANELYAEIATDFGTVRVGRTPLNWGLGLIWNNTDAPFARFPSTGDSVSMVTKLGSFKFMPAIVKYQNGSNYGGAAGYDTNGNVNTLSGTSGVSDYSLALTYDNPDEQITLGVMFIRRLTGQYSGIINPLSIDTPTTYGSYDYNTWDFYLKKKTGPVTISAEVPLITGTISGDDYDTVAAAVVIEDQMSEHWNLKVNTGLADGQGDVGAGTAPGRFTAFFFHPDYRPGFLLFNYNLANLSNGNLSPYDAPITNAEFLDLGFNYASGKWTHGFQGLYARAQQSADGVAGNLYFNTNQRIFRTENAGAVSQSKDMGWEFDYLLGYQWDENLHLGVDLGLYFPGQYYAFSNSATNNTLKTVFGSNVNLSVKF